MTKVVSVVESKISIAIAAHNEEHKLKRCLESVYGWADEVLVADCDSTDKTAEIAKKYGVTVFKIPNEKMFHKNKQIVIDKCKHDWILQLDADEVVTEELKREINEILKNDSFADAFYIPRKNYMMGRFFKKTGQYPDRVIRLFRKGKAFLPCEVMHEQMEVKGITGILDEHLYHYPYETFSEYLLKSNRYTTATMDEMIQHDIDGTMRSFFLKSVFKAIKTFFLLYFRHKGFMDGFPGFVFSFYSGLHHITSYVKYWEEKLK